MAFRRVQPRQEQRHQQSPGQGNACRPVGNRLPAAYVFPGNRPQPQGCEQYGNRHRNGIDVGNVIRAEVGGAFGKLGGPAVIHGEKARPQEHGKQPERHNAEPVDKSRRAAPQAVQLRRAEQGKRRQQPDEVVLKTLRIKGEQHQNGKHPDNAQNPPVGRKQACAANRPNRQRQRGQCEPKQIFQIVKQTECRLNVPHAAERTENVIVEPLRKQRGLRFAKSSG